MSVKFIHPSGVCTSGLIVIGEAPGEQEDLQGRPFVGRCGKLLDKMLAFIELDRESVYVTNIVKVRPPDNRTPTREELESWKPLLIRELNSLKGARVILALGACSSKTLLDTEQVISKLRGQAYKQKGIGPMIVPSFHPSYLLRQANNEDIKNAMKEDLIIAKKLLKP